MSNPIPEVGTAHTPFPVSPSLSLLRFYTRAAQKCESSVQCPDSGGAERGVIFLFSSSSLLPFSSSSFSFLLPLLHSCLKNVGGLHGFYGSRGAGAPPAPPGSATVSGPIRQGSRYTLRSTGNHQQYFFLHQISISHQLASSTFLAQQTSISHQRQLAKQSMVPQACLLVRSHIDIYLSMKFSL